MIDDVVDDHERERCLFEGQPLAGPVQVRDAGAAQRNERGSRRVEVLERVDGVTLAAIEEIHDADRPAADFERFTSPSAGADGCETLFELPGPPAVPIEVLPRAGLDAVAETLPEALFVFLRLAPSRQPDSEFL